MAKKLKWKRTRDGQIVFKEKVSLAQRFRNVGYMQVAVLTFCTGLFLFLIALGWAILSNGEAGAAIAVLWVLSLIFAVTGMYVTRYGHYVVEAKSKISWKVGIYTNGCLLLLLILVYVAGLVIR